ncbi:MAG: hypothetical protein AABX14_00085 [Candidatus Aenigmatarchaeota archaeon]
MEKISPKHIALLGLTYDDKWHGRKALRKSGVYKEALDLVRYGMLDIELRKDEQCFHITSDGKRYVNGIIRQEISSGVASDEETSI